VGLAKWVYLVSKHTQPYVKAQLDDGTWRYLEEELHKSQGLEGCCGHREGLVVVDETADEWPGKAMRANLYDELAFLKGQSVAQDCVLLSLKKCYQA